MLHLLHEETLLREIEQRHSSLAAQYQIGKRSLRHSQKNYFLSTYWLGKEEVANCKLTSLLDLKEDLGLFEMKNVQQRSQRSPQNMTTFKPVKDSYFNGEGCKILQYSSG